MSGELERFDEWPAPGECRAPMTRLNELADVVFRIEETLRLLSPASRAVRDGMEHINVLNSRMRELESVLRTLIDGHDSEDQILPTKQQWEAAREALHRKPTPKP